mmetsp:Transcript_128977/g.413115  ORF Transcript_128977/g.413115 Transcript_128977/m.413115 type:complete len:209 (-) Transcript_128977:12-638(-)
MLLFLLPRAARGGASFSRRCSRLHASRLHASRRRAKAWKASTAGRGSRANPPCRKSFSALSSSGARALHRRRWTNCVLMERNSSTTSAQVSSGARSLSARKHSRTSGTWLELGGVTERTMPFGRSEHFNQICTSLGLLCFNGPPPERRACFAAGPATGGGAARAAPASALVLFAETRKLGLRAGPGGLSNKPSSHRTSAMRGSSCMRR